MPNSARPTFTELVDQIKQESRVKGADNLDGYIGNVINELLLTYAQNNRYFEFLVTNTPISTIAATSLYDLPADFMNMRLVRYKTASGYIRTLNPRGQHIETANGSRPRWYDLAGSKLVIFPYDDLPANDTILMDYYKIPDTLSGATPFPVPRLVPSLKLDAVHRVLIYNQQLASAAALKGESGMAETRSKPADR